MSNVIDIAERRPHLAGPARCLECRHEWVQVAPVGAIALTCPSCHSDKGGRFAMVALPDGEPQWFCLCGNIFFMMTTSGILCPNCGKHQEGYE